jgi:tetratricopeptide (TPR) repeat protein
MHYIGQINIGQIIHAILTFLVLGGLGGWFVFHTVKRAEDPALMVVKWVVTVIVVVILAAVVAPFALSCPFLGVPFTAACGLILAIVWRRDIACLVADPIASLYNGGTDAPDPHPFYSVARARQKQGRYPEAVLEIQKQLARFPTDVEGQLLLAEVQAENLKDLPAAELTIEGFCGQPGHAPQNITFALYSMADWHLKVGQDRQAAQRWLEKVIELLPDTEFALGAAQRVAHLSTTEMLLSRYDRKKFIVPEGVRNLGLLKKPMPPPRIEKDPELLAADYVRHLEQHPLDMEVREKLAVIYADHYQRLDLATDELEQMIAQPNQPPRLLVHWLNLLADLQIRSGTDYESVKQTLQRVIDRNPNLASAEIARKRLALLKLEFKANENKQPVKLGSYEQNIGLKKGPPPGLYGRTGSAGSPPRP